MSFLIQLASWQVLQASNHSHRSFINLLRFPFFFFFEMQTLELYNGSLFSCRLISMYFKTVPFPQDLAKSLSKHGLNTASGRHFRFFFVSLYYVTSAI